MATTVDISDLIKKKEYELSQQTHSSSRVERPYVCSLIFNTSATCGEYFFEMKISDGQMFYVKQQDRETFLTETLRILLENIEFSSLYQPAIVRRHWSSHPSIDTIMSQEQTSWGPWVVDSLNWACSTAPAAFQVCGKRSCRSVYENKINNICIGSSLHNPGFIPFFVWGDFFESLMKIS